MRISDWSSDVCSSDLLDPASPARARLAYDEILSNQLALTLVRARMKRQKGRSLQGDGRLRRAVVDALPFKLTGSQATALAAVTADMAAGRRVLRLLQGDDGSGKTLAALPDLLKAGA